MSKEDESLKRTEREELSGERKKLRIAFHEVGTPGNALSVQVLGAHPEGLSFEETWQKTLNSLGLIEKPTAEITAIVGTFDSFRMNITNQLSHVVSRERVEEGKAQVKLHLNPEYAELAGRVSDLTLAFTEEHWIPSDYFYREARTGTLYESTRLHVARYLRQELLDDKGAPRINEIRRIKDVLKATRAKSTSVKTILDEYDRLKLCDFDSAEKGTPIVQLKLIAAPEHMETRLNLRSQTANPYPDLPLDIIKVMQDMHALGEENFKYSQIEPRLIELYEQRYKRSYPRTALYTRANKYLKRLEKDGHVTREGKKIKLNTVPENIEEEAEANLPTLPELPRQIIELFQSRQSEGATTLSYEQITRDTYRSYVEQAGEKPDISYPTFTNVIYTVLNNLIENGYVQRETQRSAITISHEHDKHILLDVAEDYNLLLQGDGEFLQDVHRRAEAISHDPQRLRAVLMDTQRFVVPQSDNERTGRQSVELEEMVQEKSQLQDIKPGEEISIGRLRPLMNSEHLQQVLSNFTVSNGSENALGEILTYISPVINYAVSLYDGFGRNRNTLYSDALSAVNEQLSALLTDEEHYKPEDFRPFTIVTTAMRQGIQDQVVHGAPIRTPEALREPVRIAEQVLGTQSIRIEELGNLLEEESYTPGSAIQREDITRILFAFKLRQVAMEYSEKNLTRVHLSDATRQKIEDMKQQLAREKVRQFLLQGSGNTFVTVRAYLKSIHEPVPPNLAEIISEVRQEIVEREKEITEAPDPLDVYRRRREALLNLTIEGGTMVAKVKREAGRRGASKITSFDHVAEIRVGRQYFTEMVRQRNLPADIAGNPIIFTPIDKNTVQIGINDTLRLTQAGSNIKMNVAPEIQAVYTLLLSISLQQARPRQPENIQQVQVNEQPFREAELLLQDALLLQNSTSRRRTVDSKHIVQDESASQATVASPIQNEVLLPKPEEPKTASPDAPGTNETVIFEMANTAISEEVEIIPETLLERAEIFLERGGALIVNEETHAAQIIPYSSDPKSDYQQLLTLNESIRRSVTDRSYTIPLRISDVGAEHYVSVLEGANLVDFYMGPESETRRPGVFNNWNRMLYVLSEYIADPTFTVRNVSSEMIQRIKEAAEKAEWSGIEIIIEGKKRNSSRSASSNDPLGEEELELPDYHELEGLQ